jgi:hypothetical protein
MSLGTVRGVDRMAAGAANPREHAPTRLALGPGGAPAIARRIGPFLPTGSDFASQLRMQLDLARRDESRG